MTRPFVWNLSLFTCICVGITGCGETNQATEPDLDGSRRNAPIVVVEDPACDPGWWMDANGTCWPSDPEEPSDPNPGDDGDWEPGGGPDDDGDADADAPCATGDPIIDDPFVQEIFAILLEVSNYSPNTPQDQRLEHYAWIIQTSTGYTFAPMGIEPAPCGIDEPVAVNTPAGAVGWVHTHPWQPGEWQWVCDPPGTYWGLPSEADVSTSAMLGLPGYIIDAKNITKFDAAAATQPVNSIVLQVPHCGRVS